MWNKFNFTNDRLLQAQNLKLLKWYNVLMLCKVSMTLDTIIVIMINHTGLGSWWVSSISLLFSKLYLAASVRGKFQRLLARAVFQFLSLYEFLGNTIIIYITLLNIFLNHGELCSCDLILPNRFSLLVAITMYLFIVAIYETFENHFHRYTVFIYN